MTTGLPLLVAVTGAAEAPLVASLRAAHGLVVVRRCADLVELLAASAAGHGRAALVSPDLRHLDRTALARLADAGTAVVGVLDGPPGGALASEQGARLSALGVTHVVDAAAGSVALVDVVTDAVRLASAPGRARGWTSAALADTAALPPEGGDRAGWTPTSAAASRGRAPTHRGDPVPSRTVAVWGTPGAPGRTMVATSLAVELAAAGESTLLVDADTTSASVALALGLLDESAGIAAACRSAAAGRLDAAALSALAPATAHGLRVLTGLPRASRWPEVGAASFARVLDVAREASTFTVVDCAASIEQDEELVHDTAAPRRHAAAVTALGRADEVLVVGAADPVGLQRLVRSVQDLADAVPTARPTVVVTKVRASSVGPSPRRQVTTTLARYAGIHDPVLLPDDRGAYDAALLAGRALPEHAPSSPLRRALAELAEHLRTRARGGSQPAGMPGAGADGAPRWWRGRWGRMHR